MLERATACLDTGARLSLRCARRASRSRRQLHQTFWTHGAGDLDLPPSLLGTTPPPPNPDDRRQDGRNGDSATATESPFLDFLYPPQALALLHRASEPRREKWEERNARRLPRGFVQATRGYASGTAERRSAENKQEAAPEETQENWLPLEFLADGKTEELVPDTGDADTAGESEHSPETTSEAPGLLDAAFPADQASSKQLRNLMTASHRNIALQDAVKSMDHTTKAWEIYEQLDASEKDNLDLKTALLKFLSTHHNEVAETHCLELYSSIPAPQRNMEIYKPALSVFLRCNLYGLAEQGHAEALERLSNAHELSGWLCRYAIEHEMWDMAFRLKHQLDARHEGILQAVAAKSFWQQITEMPDLLSKAISLSKHFRILKRTNAMSRETRDFCKIIFREGIVQEFISYNKKGSPEVSEARKSYQRRRIRYLLGEISLQNRETATFFRDVIMAVIAPSSSIHYPDVHTVVSYMYVQYRKMTGVVPEKEMLHQLLYRLRQYSAALQDTHRNAHSIKIDTIHSDWHRYHGRTPVWVLEELMTYYAREGLLDRLEGYRRYLFKTYPDYADRAKALWTLIYVHARRADVQQAKNAFDGIKRLAKVARTVPDTRCWNVLLHAHSRADDLDGALETLREMLATPGVQLTRYAFHPVLELYANKGDAESVNNMLEQYDEVCEEKRNTALYGSLMRALIKNNEVHAAQRLLGEIIEKRKGREIEGSLTGPFNMLLVTYALRREVDAAMRVYRWMKSEKVIMDADTYSALMQALISYRQSPAANKILTTVMRDKGVQPTAFHYALVIKGYINQGMYQEAVHLGRKMERKNIRKSISFNVAYLQAKALLESKHKQSSDTRELPLEDTMRDLEVMLESDVLEGVASKQPQKLNISQPGAAEAAYFEQLIYVHGKRRCLDAVKELIARYEQRTKQQDIWTGPKPATSRLLAALMVASTSAQDWKDVDECWQLAKSRADAASLLKPAPDIKAMLESQPGPEMLEMPLLYPAQEQGLEDEPIEKKPADQPLVAKGTIKDVQPKPMISHIFRLLLTPTLTQLITALRLQARFMDMISTVATVLSEGYLLDNRTWNHFIESLLDSRPPLALLAFRLTERYLIVNFPGWRYDTNLPNKSHRAQGLQHIKASYLRPGQLMPQYRTLVKLASAMLELGRMETVGSNLKPRERKLERYVGTTKLIRRLAPRTLHVVQSMPTVNDSLQRSLMPKGG